MSKTLSKFLRASNQPGVDRALSGTSLERIVSDKAQASSYEIFVTPEILEQQEFNFLHRIVLGIQKDKLHWVLKHYLSPESNIDAIDVNGRTPLTWAAWRGDHENVGLLLDSCADKNHTDAEGYTPLARAAKAGRLECVQILLKAGASITKPNNEGFEPLHHACANRSNGPAIVEELLAHSADPNAKCQEGSPLHLAANRGSLDTIKRLLETKADIDVVDCDGDTPAMVALLCWNQPAFIYLMQNGARLDLTRKTGENILHLATWAASIEIWYMIAARAHTEQLRQVCIQTQHDNHDLSHCFETCRKRWYYGQREEEEVEVAKFRKMIDAFGPSEIHHENLVGPSQTAYGAPAPTSP